MAARKKAPKPASASKSASSDNGKAGIQPSVRVFTKWTPQRIASAEVSADSGNIRQAANLTEWILTDDRVQGALGARSGALFGLDPTFEASGDKRRSNRAIKDLEGGEDWWDSYPEAESKLIFKWGLVLGLGPARHAWEQLDGHEGRVLPLPEFWHPQHLRFDWFSRKWMTRVGAGATGALEIEFMPGDSEWLMFRPYGKDRPWAWGLWHALAGLVLIKHLAEWDFSRAGEKGALLVGTTSDEVLETETRPAHRIRQDLAQQLYERGRDGVCILPAGFDLKMLQLAAGTPELYAKQIEMANTAIAVNIRGGNLTTEVKGGSLAATRTQAVTGDLVNLRDDAQSWTTFVHDQSLVWWAEFNFGDRNLAPWPVYPVEPKKDEKQAGETANLALDAAKKAHELGFKVKPKEFAEEFDLDGWLEAPKGGELVPVAPPTAAPAPSPSPNGDPKTTTEPDPDDAEDDDEPEATARAPRGRFALASGDALKNGRGFVEGQGYADAVTETHTEAGIKALRPTFEAILEDLDAATDYEDLRARLRARYQDLDPEELSDLVYSAMALGELAGRTATNQDA
jgi:hypothetical protein